MSKTTCSINNFFDYSGKSNFIPDVKIVLEEGAKLPQLEKGSVGYDLFSCESKTVPRGDRVLISSGIRISIPEGWYGRVAPRSGLSVKKNIDIGAGVIDPSYTGIVKICFINNGKDDYHIEHGDKVAQLIFEKCGLPNLCVVEKLEETERGDGGFGSTGK